jgi:hypothetical protein
MMHGKLVVAAFGKVTLVRKFASMVGLMCVCVCVNRKPAVLGVALEGLVREFCFLWRYVCVSVCEFYVCMYVCVIVIASMVGLKRCMCVYVFLFASMVVPKRVCVCKVCFRCV